MYGKIYTNYAIQVIVDHILYKYYNLHKQRYKSNKPINSFACPGIQHMKRRKEDKKEERSKTSSRKVRYEKVRLN